MHHDIETVLDDADSLGMRLALALFDDMAKAGDVGKSLANRWKGVDDVVRALNEGSHGDYDGGLERLTRARRSIRRCVRTILHWPGCGLGSLRCWAARRWSTDWTTCGARRRPGYAPRPAHRGNMHPFR